jgi:hypothetical protein
MPRSLVIKYMKNNERSELHGADSHADAEDDAGEHLLRLAFAIGEHQAADHDGEPAKPVTKVR